MNRATNENSNVDLKVYRIKQRHTSLKQNRKELTFAKEKGISDIKVNINFRGES